MIAATPGARATPVAAVVERVQERVQQAPIGPAYRAAIDTALSLPGNILSDVPDARWARLVWTCCAAACGRWGQAVPTAAAVELFMVAVDVLDDEEDGERSTLQDTVGAACALNVSTGLLLLAQQSLLDTAAGAAAAQVLLGAGLHACSGQHLDLSTTAEQCDTLSDAVAVTAEKSASLTAAICRLGAICAGADAPLQEVYARFGRCLGMVAQLTNDMVAVRPDAVGKTDILYRRPTLPLAYRALSATGGADRQDGDRGSGTDGALYVTWAVADAYRRQAVALVPALSPSEQGREDLRALLDVL
jgi:geranylgeranyl pyrophosphate synthase